MVANFYRKGNKKFFSNKLLFKTIGIIFLIVIAFLFFTDFRLYKKKRQLNEQIQVYKQQIEDIKKSNQILKDEIANFNNKDYLEKLGYEQFAQARPGETEYMFIDFPQEEKESTVLPKKNFWDVRFWFSSLVSWIKNLF